MSAEQSARTVRQADGLDPVRALQRVLYRSANKSQSVSSMPSTTNSPAVT
jgi:hypothetical protein